MITVNTANKKLEKLFINVKDLTSEINQDKIVEDVDVAELIFLGFRKHPTANRLLSLLNKLDKVTTACDCSVSFPTKDEKKTIDKIHSSVRNFLDSFDVDEVKFENEQRKLCNSAGKFFRVELTENDRHVMNTSPEVIAERVEDEFSPSTFIQFTKDGMGAQFALMKK